MCSPSKLLQCNRQFRKDTEDSRRNEYADCEKELDEDEGDDGAWWFEQGRREGGPKVRKDFDSKNKRF